MQHGKLTPYRCTSYRQCQRLLAVHMLAVPCRFDGDEGMPAPACGDEYDIEIAARQHLAEVGVLGALLVAVSRVDRGSGPLAGGLLHVAYGDHVCIRLVKEAPMSPVPIHPKRMHPIAIFSLGAA